jgi:hypothetical protein
MWGRDRLRRPVAQDIARVAAQLAASATGVLNGLDEFLRRAVLCDISHRARAEGPSRKLSGWMHTDDERRKAGVHSVELFDQIETAQARQREINDRNIPMGWRSPAPVLLPHRAPPR